MSCYYIMIKFCGSAVTGFLIPEADNEEHALKVLKRSLYLRIISNKMESYKLGSGDCTTDRIKSFLRTLRRPWRVTKERHGRRDRTVLIEKLQLPIVAGFWLTDILTNQHNCNICSNTWEPRPK
jgi:hypothetical protein